MLNLSDNELDRLSREAASQHDPGDLVGPRSWDRLEVRLDKEMGRAGPDVSRGFRGIRRLPFQYAPVLLLIVGITYYFVKLTKNRKAEPSGSPPLTALKTPQQQQPAATFDSSLKNPAYSDKSTSTLYQDHSSTSPAGSDGSTSNPSAAGASPAANAPSGATGASSNAPSSTTIASRTTPGSPNSLANSASGTSAGPNHLSGTSGTSSGKSSGLVNSTSGSSGRSGLNHPGSHHPHDLVNINDSRGSRLNHDKSDKSGRSGKSGQPNDFASTTTPAGQNTITAATEPSGPSRSLVQRPHTLHSRPGISDSALRAYVAPTPASTAKSPGLKINRSLTFGIQIAPDFTSVNTLAGDKPGSSIGITVDYQVFNRWHLGTGLLFSRKNYTARGADYHAPYGYYQSNMLKPVDFVKGTMNMLEIPLNVRYDFSVTGNTVFFASGGISAYLFGNENCNYYFDNFGREVCRQFKYTNKNTSPLSVATLSLGVETGISNSLSVLVAPYMKLPLSDIGFGKIRMNSVGINFAVRYSPVISHSRKIPHR